MPQESSNGARTGSFEAGFTYIGLMILVAILSLTTSALLTLGSIAQRREAEQRLLEVGAAYRQAITSYQNSSPTGNRRYPDSLAELLKDPRYPGVRRHLRQLYLDPITGKAEWGLVQAPGGGIMGIHSLSDARAIKIAEFEEEDRLFEGKTRYSEWVFGFQLDTPVDGKGSSQNTNPNAPIPAGPAPSPAPGLFAPQSPSPRPIPAQAPSPAPFSSIRQP